MIAIGTVVTLKATVKHHTCPVGREDNKTATVVSNNVNGVSGALWMDRDLRGCQGWNEDDVNKVLTTF